MRRSTAPAPPATYSLTALTPPTTRRGLLAALESVLCHLEAPRREAGWIATHVLGMSRAHLIAFPAAEVGADDARLALGLASRRADGEPLQYVLGEADFFGMTLRVTPAALIPRPETEQVVEAALKRIAERPSPRCLDIGTGSGAIALALARARPDASVTACDVSAGALALAQENAVQHGLSSRIRFARADALAEDFADRLRTAASLAENARFDLVISNPPYVPLAEMEEMQTEVRDHEPHLALFAGDDALLFYRAITRHAATLLAPAGTLAFETHADGMEAVADVLRTSGFERVEALRDYADLGRIVLGSLGGAAIG